jgi:hypothetical protein
MITVRSVLVTLTALAVAAGCSDHATAPTPQPPPPTGSAVVSLTTPNGDDGAVSVTLTGPGLTTLQVSSSSTLFFSRAVSDSEARVIAVGNLAAGPLFTFKVAAGHQLSAYSATVVQVATRSDSLRSNTSGYKLAITAAP